MDRDNVDSDTLCGEILVIYMDDIFNDLSIDWDTAEKIFKKEQKKKIAKKWNNSKKGKEKIKKWREHNPEKIIQMHKAAQNKKDSQIRKNQIPDKSEILLIENSIAYTPIPGIYQLILKGELQYIGSSNNVFNREVAHRVGLKNRRIKFDEFRYSPYYNNDLEDVEYRLINHYNPPMNKLKLRRKKR